MNSLKLGKIENVNKELNRISTQANFMKYFFVLSRINIRGLGRSGGCIKGESY